MPRGFESHALRSQRAKRGMLRADDTNPRMPVTSSATRRSLRESASSPRKTRGGSGKVGIARHGRLKQVTAAGSIGKFVGMAAVVLATSALILGSIMFVKFRSNLDIIPTQPGEEAPAPVAQMVGGVNILLVGSDDRTGQGKEFGEGLDEASGRLNDVNMIIHISQDLTHAEVVSIPRDTIIDTPSCTNDDGDRVAAQTFVPINSVLSSGGMNCVIKTAEKLTGLDIHHAAMVKFRGVIEMSNAVGGVPVCVSEQIDDTYVGLHLSPGNHTLQGEDALKFLRTRHGVGDGSDLARISNQQVFLSSLIRTIKSNDTLTNPVRLYGLAQAVTQNMTLTQSLNDMNTLMGLAQTVSKIPTEQISFISLPVAASTTVPGKVEPIDGQDEALWSMLRDDRSFAQAKPEPTSTGPSVDATSDTSTTEASPSESPSATSTIGPSSSPSATEAPEVQHLNANTVTCANPNTFG